MYVLGVKHFGELNLRLSFFVIAAFSIITIVSYFHELSKAGLLGGKRRLHKQLYSNKHHRESRAAQNDRLDRPDSAFIQNNGEYHRLDLDIQHIQRAISANKKPSDQQEEINFSIKLKRNDSYESVNNSIVKVYQHKNALPNFYSTLNETWTNFTLPIELHKKSFREQSKLLHNIHNLTSMYSKAKHVFMYQHEPASYFVRDCLRILAKENEHLIPSMPLNAAYRNDWDMLSKHKKDAFNIIYGALSFGVCEGFSSPCTYFTFIEHPLDRILTVYDICQEQPSSPYCKYSNLNISNITLKEYIKSQGSNLFHKLLYYSRHCKLVGVDEICLPGTKTSFVLTSNEKRMNLQNILSNLENWFGVVGLGSHMKESFNLFELVLGHDFNSCFRKTTDAMKQFLHFILPFQHKLQGYSTQSLSQSHTSLKHMSFSSSALQTRKQLLLKDADIVSMLQPDLTIYEKLEEIFYRQLRQYNVINRVEESVNLQSRKHLQQEKHMHINSKHRKHNHHHSNGKSETKDPVDVNNNEKPLKKIKIKNQNVTKHKKHSVHSESVGVPVLRKHHRQRHITMALQTKSLSDIDFKLTTGELKSLTSVMRSSTTSEASLSQYWQGTGSEKNNKKDSIKKQPTLEKGLPKQTTPKHLHSKSSFKKMEKQLKKDN